MIQHQEAMIVIDGDGCVMFWNRGAETLFGWTASQMVGESLQRIMPARHWGSHQAALGRLREGYPPRLMGKVLYLEAVNAAGEEFPIELALRQLSELANPEPGDWRYLGVIRRRA
jgi:PAS domain S-box-containing protein